MQLVKNLVYLMRTFLKEYEHSSCQKAVLIRSTRVIFMYILTLLILLTLFVICYLSLRGKKVDSSMFLDLQACGMRRSALIWDVQVGNMRMLWSSLKRIIAPKIL